MLLVRFPDIDKIRMPRTVNRRTDAEWEELIARYLASGLSQAAFCEQEGVSRFSFSPRYQRSPQFVGKRRERTAAGTSAPAVKNGFRRVAPRHAPPTTANTARIRIGDNIHIELAGDIALDVIVRLAAEARA